MPALITRFGAVLAAVTTMTVIPAEAQQQVIVTVVAAPNPVPPGSCARIVAEVRDEQNRQLMPDNGAPLQWSYSSANGVDFEWRSPGASGESELCAKPGAAAVSTQVTATIMGMEYSGATIVAIAASAHAAGQPGISPGPSAGPPAASPAAVPTQPYVPPAQPTTTHQPAASAAAQPQPAATAAPQQAAGQVKTGGGFFKKLGSHIKQRASEVKAATGQNLTAAATGIVDTAFQTGTRLVASTTAEVTNTARAGIGGVGRSLTLVPQRAGGNADNLAIAIASGRAVLPEIRFTPGTSVLEPSGRDLVNRLGAELRNEMARAPAIQFEIYAHVDSGPAPQVLSEERAAAVKAVLGNYTDARRLTALGFGASQPMPGVPGSRIEIVRCNDGQTKCWR